MRRPGHLLPALPGLLVAVALGSGCASQRQAPVRVHVGDAGGSASLVLCPLETSAVLAHLPPGPEFARRDGELAVRPAQPLLATAQWPREARPSITRQRRIHIPQRDGTFLFFLDEPPPHRPPPPHPAWPHPW